MLARGSICSSYEWNRCWSVLFSTTSPATSRCNVKFFHSSAVLFARTSKSKPPPKEIKKHIPKVAAPKIVKKETTKTITPQPKRPHSIQYEEGDSLIKYRPSPSVPPIRAKFTDFLNAAKENKITIADIPVDVSKKELLEMLQYLQGKSALKDLTLRVKELNSAVATLLSKLLQTCENLHSFRIFYADFHGPSSIHALEILTRGILNSEKLENISLESCRLSNPAWDEIITWAHKSMKLKTIDLRRSKLTDPIAVKLVQAIVDNKNVCLEKIDLSQNMINDETVTSVLELLNPVSSVTQVTAKTYDVYRHNWARTLAEVQRKNEERKEEIEKEINKYREALKEEFVPKPLSTFHSNENEYIDPRNADRLKRRNKEGKAVKAYSEFDYLKDANQRDVLKKINLLKRRVQSKRGLVVKLK